MPRPPGELYRRLLDLRSYGTWWPGASARPRDGGLSLDLPAAGVAAATTEGHREDTGLYVRLDGRGLQGTLEWYLEPFKEGTVVHVIVDAEPRGRWSARRVRRLRAGIRSALTALRAGR